MKCGFKLVFNFYEYCPFIKSKVSDIKSKHSWEKFIKNVTKDFKSKAYNFNHKAETNLATIANKMDTSYDFFIKHIKLAIEWKLIPMINKNEIFI